MTRLVSVVTLFTAATALAVAPGSALYISCKEVKLLKEPKASSKPVLPAALKDGDEVMWLGASAKDKTFHEVSVRGKKGFVQQTCLKLSKPMSEVAEEGRTMSAQAFASSGAATKGLPPQRYQGNSESERAAAAELEKLEELNKSIDSAALDKKQKELIGGK